MIADKFYVSNPIYAAFSVSQKLKLSFSTSVGFSNKVEKNMNVSMFDFCWQQSSQLKFVISDVYFLKQQTLQCDRINKLICLLIKLKQTLVCTEYSITQLKLKKLCLPDQSSSAESLNIPEGYENF